MGNYTMYRFYKGGKNNPFNSETDGLSAKFWYYEYVFDSSFFKEETSELYSFFKDHDMGNEFMALLSEADHDNISEKTKKAVFELWLKYLFEYKLYPEYGGENKLEKLYYSTTGMMKYDQFKLQGLESFSEFRYYKGEVVNPYDVNENEIQFRWWNFEKDYFDNYKKSGTWKTFYEFLNHWIKEKAAPEIGYDLENGNKWLEEYQGNTQHRKK